MEVEREFHRQKTAPKALEGWTDDDRCSREPADVFVAHSKLSLQIVHIGEHSAQTFRRFGRSITNRAIRHDRRSFESPAVHFNRNLGSAWRATAEAMSHPAAVSRQEGRDGRVCASLGQLSVEIQATRKRATGS